MVDYGEERNVSGGSWGPEVGMAKGNRGADVSEAEKRNERSEPAGVGICAGTFADGSGLGCPRAFLAWTTVGRSNKRRPCQDAPTSPRSSTLGPVSTSVVWLFAAIK